MSTGIYQVLVNYEKSEDRLLLKVSTHDAREFRAWMTRRFVKQVWGILVDTVTVVSPKTDGTETTKQVQIKASFEKTVKEANRSKAFEHKEGKEVSYPLGETPLLLNQAIISKSSTGVHRIQLLPETGQGIDLNMNNGLISPVLQMIFDACEKQAEWKLDLVLPGHLKQREKLPSLLS